ncbi:hypothetical protein FRC10_004164 [Ceratobasidium sp. 414]|nr:hypothetical protein FRC10_004164 [Ceratobasidium sp. 414]
MSVAGTTSEAAHGPRREGPSSDDEYLYPPLGTHPGRVQVDAWFEEFKARRAALWKTRERVLEIRCPMEECRKAQKCPQALRVSDIFITPVSVLTVKTRRTTSTSILVSSVSFIRPVAQINANT